MAKELGDRLQDYKILKHAVENGKQDSGYVVPYEQGGVVSYLFKNVKGHLVIEGTINYGYHTNSTAVDVLDSDDVETAMNRCYDLTMNFLRRKSKVEYGRIWPDHVFPFLSNSEDGSGRKTITTISNRFSEFLDRSHKRKLTTFGNQPKEIQELVNRKRKKRGLDPAQVFVAA